MNPVTMKMPDKTEDPESDLVVNETREQWAERKRRDRSNSSRLISARP